MTAWLESSDRDDAIRLVAGGPGSGKSSFAKAFAAGLVRAGTHRVLFVELQHMRMGAAGDTLKASIGRHLTNRHGFTPPDRCEGFPDNPLDWYQEDHKPILMVFDGLDELTSNLDRASELTERFVSNLGNMLNDMNRGTDRARAIVLGRDLAIDDALKEAGRSLESVLHVAPIRPMIREDLRLDGNPSDDRIDADFDPVDDPHGLMEKDLRLDYWPRWCAAIGQDAQDPPESITDESMKDLNVEPLLLHLLIISDYCDERWQEAADNRNLVYQDILSKVFARNKKKNLDAYNQLEEKNFFELMEVFALAAFRGNGRTGDSAAFEKLRKLYAKPKDERVYAEMDGASLKSVALLIHSQRDIEGAGFEFVHKSFGEYLTARALIGGADRLRNLRESDYFDGSEADLALRWCRWIGDGVLSTAIGRFLGDEARLRPPADAAIAVLTEIFDHTLRHGFPVQDAKEYGNPTYRALERLQRAAEKCMLTVLTALAQARKERAVISFEALSSSKNMAMAMTQRAFPVWEQDTDLPAQLDLLDFGNQILGWANLIKANLIEADLGGANLFEANLFEANLSRANLSRADLIEANLSGADLRRANLSGANLRRANLGVANLSGANLSRATLFEANLGVANLSGANLSRADLFAVNLIEADLSGADLRGANLSGANLIEADLSGANLFEANLGGANLSGATLFEANLGRADLFEANLSGATLKSTDLRDCRMGHTSLRSVDFTGSRNLGRRQLASAFGVRAGIGRTILPDGMAYPDHWHDAEDAAQDSRKACNAYHRAYLAWRESQS